MSKRRVGGRESQEDAEGTNFKETSHEMIPHIEVEEEEVVCCKTSGVSSKNHSSYKSIKRMGGGAGLIL